jgi:hypothetical protein
MLLLQLTKNQWRTIVNRTTCLNVALVAVILSLFAGLAHADLITGWNFNNYTAGGGSDAGSFNATGTFEVYTPASETLSPSTWGGSSASSLVSFANLVGNMGGTANNNWGLFTGATNNAINGDVAGGALTVIGSGNNDHYVDFILPTQGFGNITLNYATRGTSTGFSTHQWGYSINGVNWVDLTSISANKTSTWSVSTVNFPAAVNDLSSVHFRMIVSGATGTGGNNRIDNVQFNGTPVPEPSTFVLLGGMLAAIGGLFLRHRNS